MNAPSEDIKDMLASEFALGLFFAVNLFIGDEPDSPNNCVTIYDTVGTPNSYTLQKEVYERPSVQIRVRNERYDTGWELIAKIADFLQSKLQETIEETLYTNISIGSGPAFIDRDSKDRIVHIVNINIQRVDTTEAPTNPNLFTGFDTLGDGWVENVNGSYTSSGVQTATSFLDSSLVLEAGVIYEVDITATETLGQGGFLVFPSTVFTDPINDRVIQEGNKVYELTAVGGTLQMSIAATTQITFNINSIRKK